MKKYILSILKVLCLVAILFVALFPLVWMGITSGKSMTERLKIPVTILPEKLDLSSYYEVWVQKPFPRYIWNSVKISAVATVTGMIVASLAAYGFAKFRFPLKKFWLMFVLVAQMFPSTSVIIPLFSTYKSYGLYDTHVGLMLLYSTISLAFSIWMMYGYFKGVPKELEEAARIDGASELYTFHRIAIPIMSPGIATMSIMGFIGGWNAYLLPMIILNKNEKFTLPVMMATLRASTDITANQGAIYLAVAISVIPILLVFAFFSKYISSISAGAVKE